MTTLVLEDPNLKEKAKHILQNTFNHKKTPEEYELYGIPLEKPVGTVALWYRHNRPNGYLRPEQKRYYGKNIRCTQIDSTSDLYYVMQDGKHPRYVMEVIDYKGQ